MGAAGLVILVGACGSSHEAAGTRSGSAPFTIHVELASQVKSSAPTTVGIVTWSTTGGAAPACSPVPDGGTCPTGYTLGFCQQVIGGGSGQGCQPPPCTPPAAYCADIPASCASPPTCGCLPTSVCHGGGTCVNVSASSVTCLSA